MIICISGRYGGGLDPLIDVVDERLQAWTAFRPPYCHSSPSTTFNLCLQSAEQRQLALVPHRRPYTCQEPGQAIQSTRSHAWALTPWTFWHAATTRLMAALPFKLRAELTFGPRNVRPVIAADINPFDYLTCQSSEIDGGAVEKSRDSPNVLHNRRFTSSPCNLRPEIRPLHCEGTSIAKSYARSQIYDCRRKHGEER